MFVRMWESVFKRSCWRVCSQSWKQIEECECGRDPVCGRSCKRDAMPRVFVCCHFCRCRGDGRQRDRSVTSQALCSGCMHLKSNRRRGSNGIQVGCPSNPRSRVVKKQRDVDSSAERICVKLIIVFIEGANFVVGSV